MSDLGANGIRRYAKGGKRVFRGSKFVDVDGSGWGAGKAEGGAVPEPDEGLGPPPPREDEPRRAKLSWHQHRRSTVPGEYGRLRGVDLAPIVEHDQGSLVIGSDCRRWEKKRRSDLPC